jgi:hypothetical protein
MTIQAKIIKKAFDSVLFCPIRAEALTKDNPKYFLFPYAKG